MYFMHYQLFCGNSLRTRRLCQLRLLHATCCMLLAWSRPPKDALNEQRKMLDNSSCAALWHV